MYHNQLKTMIMHELGSLSSSIIQSHRYKWMVLLLFILVTSSELQRQCIATTIESSPAPEPASEGLETSPGDDDPVTILGPAFDAFAQFSCGLEFSARFVSIGDDGSEDIKNTSFLVIVGDNVKAPLAAISPPVTADAAIVQPGDPENFVGAACSQIRNADEIKGKFCFVSRDFCSIQTKFVNCKDAGAVGMLIIDSQDEMRMFNANIDKDFPTVLLQKTLGDSLVNEVKKDFGPGGFRTFKVGQGIPQSCV